MKKYLRERDVALVIFDKDWGAFQKLPERRIVLQIDFSEVRGVLSG